MILKGVLKIHEMFFKLERKFMRNYKIITHNVLHILFNKIRWTGYVNWYH